MVSSSTVVTLSPRQSQRSSPPSERWQSQPLYHKVTAQTAPDPHFLAFTLEVLHWRGIASCYGSLPCPSANVGSLSLAVALGFSAAVPRGCFRSVLWCHVGAWGQSCGATRVLGVSAVMTRRSLHPTGLAWSKFQGASEAKAAVANAFNHLCSDLSPDAELEVGRVLRQGSFG